MKDAADNVTPELPGLEPPAPPRVRAGMIVQCDGILCRVATVFKGGQTVEIRTYCGAYVGVRSIHSLVFPTPRAPMDAHGRAAGRRGAR